jgi:hypothetical protein
LQNFLEKRNEGRSKKSQTENWLISLQGDIDSLPPLKKAKLKLKIQSLIVDAMEEEPEASQNDNFQYIEEYVDYESEQIVE